MIKFRMMFKITIFEYPLTFPPCIQQVFYTKIDIQLVLEAGKISLDIHTPIICLRDEIELPV